VSLSSSTTPTPRPVTVFTGICSPLNDGITDCSSYQRNHVAYSNTYLSYCLTGMDIFRLYSAGSHTDAHALPSVCN